LCQGLRFIVLFINKILQMAVYDNKVKEYQTTIKCLGEDHDVAMESLKSEFENILVQELEKGMENGLLEKELEEKKEEVVTLLVFFILTDGGSNDLYICMSRKSF